MALLLFASIEALKETVGSSFLTGVELTGDLRIAPGEAYDQLRQKLLKQLSTIPSRAGVFNLLSSRTNLHLSCNPAGRSHCRLQNHHEHLQGHGQLAR